MKKLRLKQSNPINTEHFEQSFRLQLADREELIKQFELFIQKNWNSSLLPNMMIVCFVNLQTTFYQKTFIPNPRHLRQKTYLLYIMNYVTLSVKLLIFYILSILHILHIMLKIFL